MAKIVTFNCNSFRNNIETVTSLLDCYDIVLLQELMLLNDDVHLVKNIHPDWDSCVQVRDCINDGIMVGRPQKGVAILWKKMFSSSITPIYFDECINCIKIVGIEKSILLINIYMPFDKKDDNSLVNYVSSVSALRYLIHDSNCSDILLMGDFNTRYNVGNYGGILNDFLSEFNLIKADLVMPSNSFTYLSHAHNTTSWIDHILCSKSLASTLHNLHIRYDLSLYDHFPLACTLETNISHVRLSSSNENLDKKFVYWNKLSETEMQSYKENVKRFIDMNDLNEKDVCYCQKYDCREIEHLDQLDSMLMIITDILHRSSENFTIYNKNIKKCIPGWNELVKPYYIVAQEYFLNWKEGGRIRHGTDYENMTSSRANFKRVLKQCRKDETHIRNVQMANNLQSKKIDKFWNNVRKIKNNKFQPPSVIDNKTEHNSIANSFADLYKDIFNDPKCKGDIPLISNDISPYDIFYTFTSNNMEEAINKLNPSIGPDFIHAYHLKYCTDIIGKVLSRFFNACLMHNYLPSSITNATVNPLIKNKFENIHDPKNYRPIFSSSIFLKVFEYAILDKIEHYLTFNDRQHGFRRFYSTTTANVVLKETIHNYTHKNSNVYACLMDLTKAFDKVTHCKLFEKLFRLGVPSYFVNILSYWYSHQNVFVKFQNGRSHNWIIGNGVRQGGILSPWLFNVYIDEILASVSSLKYGCRFGLTMSNIIGYADDIVLLAPTRESLQKLIDVTYNLTSDLNLNFNPNKTVCMIFRPYRLPWHIENSPVFYLNNHQLNVVGSTKYLGTILSDDLREKNDMIRCRNSFFNSFNSILRKFSSLDSYTLMFLFKSYCTHMYGADLWMTLRGCSQVFKQFSIGYHKAIKKIFQVSTRESNHDICNFAGAMTFKHLINFIQIRTIVRLYSSPCLFLMKNLYVFKCMFFIQKVRRIFEMEYGVGGLIDNDMDAIKARILYVQAREATMR